MNQIFHSNQSKGLIPLFFFVCRVREAVCCCVVAVAVVAVVVSVRRVLDGV